MRELLARLWHGEPVYVLTFAATVAPLLVNGAVLFTPWNPSADQLAWVISVPQAA